MVFKASILLLALTATLGPFAQASSLETALNESVQKKDWPEVVLLLQPLQGQNFEHDLQLARALLSLERRQEALKLLANLWISHKDEKTQKLFNLAGTIFFSQDTANLFYEAVQLLTAQKFGEAKERLDQAAAKEPGQIMVLTRLIQMEILLGLKDAARNHLLFAQAHTPVFPELKLFAIKLDLDAPEVPDEEKPNWYRELLPQKSALLDNEVTLTFWAEALKRSGKEQELTSLGQKLLKEHPTWTYALAWLVKNSESASSALAAFKTQIEKNLKDRAQYDFHLQAELKRNQYLWVGYDTYEGMQSVLLKQVK